MARKILNRRELRKEVDASERLDSELGLPEDGGPDAGAKGEGATEVKAKKPPAKRKSRSKPVKEVRLKAFWGVFSQSLNQVAQFEYNQSDEAKKKAADLTESKKSPHFVQLVKKVIEE
jgi:hypothetical protein